MEEFVMATGRGNKIVGQTGEYLVAAELSRRGLIATTFTGNVPHYDIIASDEGGRHVSVQVKTSRGPSWQFGDVRRFFDVSLENKRQVVGPRIKCPIERLIVVFVRVGDYGSDEFYVLTWQQLCDLLARLHSEYLDKHGGVRPKRWDSFHAAISVHHLSGYRDKWDTVKKHLR
jgi:hypothetical protein